MKVRSELGRLIDGDAEGSGNTSEEVAKRAYELYVERGRENGGALDDWLAAEKEWFERQPTIQKTRFMVAESSTGPESKFKGDAANDDRFSSPRAFLTSR